MMEETVRSVISFLVYFSTGLAYVMAFGFIYIWITPYSEIKLIRSGNTSAAMTLGGALLGYAIPLSKAIQQSESAVDLLVWASLALVVQMLIFLGLHLLIPGLSKRIKENGLAEAILLAIISVVAGLLNSASMTV